VPNNEKLSRHKYFKNQSLLWVLRKAFEVPTLELHRVEVGLLLAMLKVTREMSLL